MQQQGILSPRGVEMIEVMGVAILGIILAYIWRSNGQMQRYMVRMLETMSEGQKEIAAGQKEIAQMLFNQTKILERMEARMGQA